MDRYVKAKIIQHVNSAMVIYGALSYFPRELKSINVIGAGTSQMECFIPTAGNSVYYHFCIIAVFYPWKADTEGSPNKKRFLDAQASLAPTPVSWLVTLSHVHCVGVSGPLQSVSRPWDGIYFPKAMTNTFQTSISKVYFCDVYPAIRIF